MKSGITAADARQQLYSPKATAAAKSVSGRSLIASQSPRTRCTPRASESYFLYSAKSSPVHHRVTVPMQIRATKTPPVAGNPLSRAAKAANTTATNAAIRIFLSRAAIRSASSLVQNALSSVISSKRLGPGSVLLSKYLSEVIGPPENEIPYFALIFANCIGEGFVPSPLCNIAGLLTLSPKQY